MSHYDFSHVNHMYCFSDIEGENPFHHASFPGLVFENGMLAEVGNGGAAVFIGDLIDHGRYPITLLLNMLAVKQKAPKRVILIAGNRDINKLRFADECYIESEQTNLPALRAGESVVENIHRIWQGWGAEYSFKYGEKELGPLLDFELYQRMAGYPERFKDRHDLTRLDWIYDSTMSATRQVYYMYENMRNVLRGLPVAPEIGYKRVAVCVMNMVMSRVWPSKHVPSGAEMFNGLYLRYLESCHICATFEHSRGRLSFVSHAGMPEAFRHMGNHMSVYPNTPIPKLVGAFHKRVLGTLRRAQKASCRSLLRDVRGVEDLVHMSFMNEDFGVGRQDAYIPPDVSSLEYDVFGHRPKGLAPEARRVGATWHVCMDVSKIEGMTNRTSYAMLVIPRVGDAYVKGRVKLISTDKNRILGGCTVNKPITYKQTLLALEASRSQGYDVTTGNMQLSAHSEVVHGKIRDTYRIEST